MDAVKFLKERKRLCKSNGGNCEYCPLESQTCMGWDVKAEEIVPIVEKWSAEHPQKTRLMDLLEKFPKFSMGTNNLPMVLPRLFGYCGRGRCQGCEHQNEEESCWNLPLEE